MAINEAVLTSFYDHGRSDHTDGALAVRYLSAEVGVGRGAESFAENGGCAVNGVGARFIGPPPTFHLNAVKIKTRHEG